MYYLMHKGRLFLFEKKEDKKEDCYGKDIGIFWLYGI